MNKAQRHEGWRHILWHKTKIDKLKQIPSLFLFQYYKTWNWQQRNLSDAYLSAIEIFAN